MASDELIFYDLACLPPNKSWSLSTWRIRLILNYKQIPYKTVWLEYPDVEPTLKPHHPPHHTLSPSNRAHYTVPAIQFPDGRFLMDSEVIALELSSKYPDPTLEIDAQTLQRLLNLVGGFLDSTANVFIPLAISNLMNARSAEFYTKNLPHRFGKSLEDMQAHDLDFEAVWEKTLPWLREIADLLKGEGGPFIGGRSKPTYADFVLLGVLLYVRAIDEMLLLKIVREVPELAKLFAACEPWVKRDDH